MIYRIIHEAPSAPGVSLMEVARVEAADEADALRAWSGKTPSIVDGTPILRYGFGDVVLRQYVAVAA